jgi:hypothetical protein
MDFGDVVLENRPIVICQCKYDICVTCNAPKDGHMLVDDENEASLSHNFYQRSKIWGPRVVINQQTRTGKCNDCGKQYEVNVFAHSDVVSY